ncbi:uncharacterized protein LOC142821334 [Pelodiscus sinensis]|uniref:uncharacterized protein LOC142821334 n=1 Tax=Pelodiscus sinensis TaxID=13735 RepID=UPI003F6D37A5
MLGARTHWGVRCVSGLSSSELGGSQSELSLSLCPAPLSPSTPELPPAPWIALAPRHPGFLPGEQVTFRCSAPPGQEVARYRFYRQPGELIGAGVPDPTGSTRLDLSAGPGTAGLYVCVYWARRAGREVPSKKSRPVAVSLIDHPPKPSVLLAPDSLAYVSGDRVEICCLAPPTASPEWFSFYQSGKVIGHQPGNTSTWQLDLQRSGTGNATRSFSCTYEQRIQGRPVPSHTSDPVSIPVFPAPAAPSLRLIPPHPLYVTGETVTAECVAPAGPYEPRAHRLQRDEEPGAEMLGPWHDLTVTPSTRGRYRCEYSTELHGRRLQSPPSPSVVLEVTDPPPPPELSVDSPSGVVSEGAPLLLTCRAPGDTTQRRFHFYQDGAELSPPEPSASPERRFPQAAPNNSGNFTCGYEEPVGGRWILSLPSRAVNVAVAGPPEAPASGGSTSTRMEPSSQPGPGGRSSAPRSLVPAPSAASRRSHPTAVVRGARGVPVPWIVDAAIGGSFFLIIILIFLITHVFL